MTAYDRLSIGYTERRWQSLSSRPLSCSANGGRLGAGGAGRPEALSSANGSLGLGWRHRARRRRVADLVAALDQVSCEQELRFGTIWVKGMIVEE